MFTQNKRTLHRIVKTIVSVCRVQRKKKTAKEKTSILYKSVVNDVGASHYFMYLI